jgi:SCP-2 sterol transfer family
MAAPPPLLTLLASPRAAQRQGSGILAETRTGQGQASGPVGQFFNELAEAAYVDTFARQAATLRFDALHGDKVDSWHIHVHDGEVDVSRQNDPADAVVRLSKADLEQIVTGRMNAQAATLRGLLSCQGDLAALMMFQRCLPGPPGSTGRVEPISGQTVMAQRRPA